MTTIVEIAAAPIDIELIEPFGIATGAQLAARNVIVTLRLADGTTGLGEAAPFPAVNGETREAALAALAELRPAVLGMRAEPWLDVAAALRNAAAGSPSALCAVECALLDALCRRARRSLWQFFGAATPELHTDITIVTGPADDAAAVAHATEAAQKAIARGFDVLKVKIGGGTLVRDAARIRAIAEIAPHVRLVLDANASHSPAETVELCRAIGRARDQVALLEQPGPPGDHDAARRIREQTKIPVAADESARSAADVDQIAAERAADVVNVKTMKSGFAEALRMIAAARAHGLGLMIGGMVESRLAMTASACLAAGQGGFSFVDLDTPLFMKDERLHGGWRQDGPRLRLDEIGVGHGVALSSTL